MHRIFPAQHRKQRVLLFKAAVGLVAGDRFVDLEILHHSSPMLPRAAFSREP
jgi:hypothetical protein